MDRAQPLDRWMLPGDLARALVPGPPGRTPRDWAVDSLIFVAAVAFAVAEYANTVVADAYGLPDWIRLLEPWLAAVACGALWRRRRFPLTTALVAALVASISNLATIAVLVLLFSLALHRGWAYALPVVVLTLPLGLPYIWLYYPDPLFMSVLIGLLLLLVTTAGLAVRARRQLVLVLALRADELRRDYERRLDDSRRDERERIAREMHDTLAHRISLLSVHAGALEYRTEMAESGTAAPMTAAEVHGAVGVMRTNAHLALDELGEVLAVLRHTGTGAEPPQPTVERLPDLVDEARRSGQRVEATFDGDLAALRPQLQRTVYRMVQEGLTNARKHAPGATVAVRVRAADGAAGRGVAGRGVAERGVEVEVSNPAPVGVTTSEIPGAGAGLTGLTERVELHGGCLTRTVVDGRFTLAARLPT